MYSIPVMSFVELGSTWSSSVLTWILAAILFTSSGARSHVCGWVVFVFTLAEGFCLDLYIVSCVTTSGLWREGLHLSIESNIEAFTWGRKLIPASETLFQIQIRKVDNVQKIVHCIHSQVCSHLLTLVPHARNFYFEDGGDTLVLFSLECFFLE
jgi:hypothetical protein